MAEKIKIALAGDPHCEIVHDGVKRLNTFIGAAKKKGADLMIHLGDLTYPNDCRRSDCPIELMPENVYDAYMHSGEVDHEESLRLFEGAGIPFYHVMGNHEFDFSSPEDIAKLYKIPGTYYAFHVKGWHFIVIDGNFFKRADGTLEHYSRGQYFLSRDLPYISSDQLEWLKGELSKYPEEPAILLSHQPLFDTLGGIRNFAELERVLSEAEKNGKRIPIMIYGHLHRDELTVAEGRIRYGVNSMSNMWVGKRLQYSGRFSEQIERKFPALKYVIPYRDAVYSIATLDEDGISVEGVSSRYVQPGPRKLGYKRKISPGARSWSMAWQDK